MSRTAKRQRKRQQKQTQQQQQLRKNEKIKVEEQQQVEEQESEDEQQHSDDGQRRQEEEEVEQQQLDEEEEESGEEDQEEGEDESDDDQDDDDGEEEDEEEESDDDEEPGKFKKSEQNKSFESDLGYICGFNKAPLDPEQVKNVESREKYLRDEATSNFKILFGELMKLPKDGESEKESVKELPDPVFRLPRQKIIPKPRPETRWEKFAKEKGIQNKKRERMVWDEATQAWAPRWGYQRANDDTKDWCIELKSSDDPTVDKFAERREAKKLRVMKNREKFLRNQAEAAGLDNVATLDKSKRGMDRVMSSLKQVQVSTASLGRFDTVMEGEPEKKYGAKKRRFQANESVSDNDRDKKILSKLLNKHIGGGSNDDQDAGGKRRKSKGKNNKKKRQRI